MHIRQQIDLGRKCYYWSYYKENENEDINYNPRYMYKDWYIYQKYDNLKHEILNNKNGHNLNRKQWNRIYNKALTYMHTSYIKKQIVTENLFNNYNTKKNM